MTSMGGATCANPQWLPDGQTILFNARAAGSADLYLLRWTTGEVQRLTSDPLDEAEARGPRDSRSIYFGSNRTGRIEVWNMPVGGGRPRQVTRSGGTAASESPDGRFLYYAKRAASPTSIRRMPVQGGAETLVTEGLSDSLNFVLANRGLYFMSVGSPHHEVVDRVRRLHHREDDHACALGKTVVVWRRALEGPATAVVLRHRSGWQQSDIR